MSDPDVSDLDWDGDEDDGSTDDVDTDATDVDFDLGDDLYADPESPEEAVDGAASWAETDPEGSAFGGTTSLSWEDVSEPRFGQTVQFPDGTTVENPHQDALGYVYPTTDDWISGTNKHVPEN